MTMPKQSSPVIRPDLVRPHETVDVVHGTPEQLMQVRVKLLAGANYNDPQCYAVPSYSRMQVSGRRK